MNFYFSYFSGLGNNKNFKRKGIRERINFLKKIYNLPKEKPAKTIRGDVDGNNVSPYQASSFTNVFFELEFLNNNRLLPSNLKRDYEVLSSEIIKRRKLCSEPILTTKEEVKVLRSLIKKVINHFEPFYFNRFD